MRQRPVRTREVGLEMRKVSMLCLPDQGRCLTIYFCAMIVQNCINCHVHEYIE